MGAIPEDKLDGLLARCVAVERQLPTVAGGGEEYVRLSREYAELTPVVAVVREYRRARDELRDIEQLREDPETDPDLRELAAAEWDAAKRRLDDLEGRVRIRLLPRDEADERNAILEIRAGTGGEEAALFAAEMFRMYRRYAEARRWKFEVLSAAEKEYGGVREAQALVSGRGVFERLKFESGVHRVQRVPETESSGRIHTSTATVAVLPEAEEVDVHVEEKDLRVDVYRASGPGGQSVNTTDSAVRITHLPSGIVVTQQDEKSQHKNRAKAMKILRARLYERERAEAAAKRAEARRGLVGTGDRSERVRTYNFPQGRVTDHRTGLTLHKLDQVLAGEALDEVLDALVAEDQASRLAALESG